MAPLPTAQNRYAAIVQSAEQAGRFHETVDLAQKLWDERRHDLIHSFWNVTATGAPAVYRPKLKKGENRVDWSTGRAVEVHELMPPRKELADVRVKLDEMTNRISST